MAQKTFGTASSFNFKTSTIQLHLKIDHVWVGLELNLTMISAFQLRIWHFLRCGNRNPVFLDFDITRRHSSKNLDLQIQVTMSHVEWSILLEHTSSTSVFDKDRVGQSLVFYVGFFFTFSRFSFLFHGVVHFSSTSEYWMSHGIFLLFFCTCIYSKIPPAQLFLSWFPW